MAQSTFAGTAGSAASGVQPGSPKALIESDRVEGTAVYGSDNSHIGTIKRLMIDKMSGQVAYAVMSFGGFLGLGEDTYTIPWSKLDYDPEEFAGQFGNVFGAAVNPVDRLQNLGFINNR